MHDTTKGEMMPQGPSKFHGNTPPSQVGLSREQLLNIIRTVESQRKMLPSFQLLK
jgi:hypothetical protein